MKRTLRIVALILMLVMAVTAFSACGKRISGIYEYVNPTTGKMETFVFDGRYFTYNYDGMELAGTYRVKKDDGDFRIFMTCKEQTYNGKTKELEEKIVIGNDKNEDNFRGLEIYFGEGFIVIDDVRYTQK